MIKNIYNLLSYFLKKSEYRFLILCIFFSILVIFFRNHNLYPSVFTDEQFHSYFARLIEFKSITIPSYIFYLIYKTTSICGVNFLECGRLLNILFFSIGCLFIYAITRKHSSFIKSILICLLTLLGPLNIYTAYFIPESLYFCFFWFLIYFILNTKNKIKSCWINSAIILGLMSLIKPHAIFLAPCIVTYLILTNEEKEIKNILLLVLYFIFFFFITKYILQILFIGFEIQSLTIFGKIYNEQLNDYFPENINNLKVILINTLINIKGNLLFLCLIFSLPIILLLKNIFIFNTKLFNKNLSILTILSFTTLIIIYGLFTGLASSFLDYEKPTRLNTRYFYFLFPLFIILIFNELSNLKIKITLKKKVIISSGVIVCIIYALLTQLHEYLPTEHLVDGPLYRGFSYNPFVFNLLGILSLLSVIMWLYNEKVAIKFYCYFFLTLTFLLTNIPTNKELFYYKKPTIYDVIAKDIKKILLYEENKNILIVNDEERNIGEITKILFHLDNANNSYKIIKNFNVNQKNLSLIMPEIKNEQLTNKNSTKWLLLMNYKMNINFPVKFKDDNFILIKLSDLK